VDWPAIHETGRDLLSRNRLTEIATLRFWSKDRYTLAERVVDPDDPESCKPFEMGEVVVMRVEPPEKRRHRLVVRELGRRVGSSATLKLKNGRELRGVVAGFDAESETGLVGGVPFVAAQVLAVGD
jgi:hypothetical protein